jgi:hypothetical protein
MSYTFHMLNQRPRRAPPQLPVLYAEDMRKGTKLRLLISTHQRVNPIVTLIDELPDNYWRVRYEDGGRDVVHASCCVSLPLERKMVLK